MGHLRKHLRRLAKAHRNGMHPNGHHSCIDPTCEDRRLKEKALKELEAFECDAELELAAFEDAPTVRKRFDAKRVYGSLLEALDLTTEQAAEIGAIAAVEIKSDGSGYTHPPVVTVEETEK